MLSVEVLLVFFFDAKSQARGYLLLDVRNMFNPTCFQFSLIVTAKIAVDPQSTLLLSSPRYRSFSRPSIQTLDLWENFFLWFWITCTVYSCFVDLRTIGSCLINLHAYKMIHGGPALQFLSPLIFDALVNDISKVVVSVQDVYDAELQSSFLALVSAGTLEEAHRPLNEGNLP